MPGSSGLVILLLLGAVGGPLALYALVRDEHDQRERMDREAAEREVRRDK